MSALKIDAPNLVLVAARCARDGQGIFVHLREGEGAPATLNAGHATEVNVLEEPVGATAESISSSPWRQSL